MHIKHSVKTAYTLTCQGQTHTLQKVDREKDLGVLMTSDLKPRHQCCKAADKAMIVLRIRHFKDIGVKDLRILFKGYDCSTPLGRLRTVRVPYLQRDIDCLEKGAEEGNEFSQRFK